MGCDIHLFVERKDADGKWVGTPVGYPEVTRDYAGFAALAPCGRGTWECTPQMRKLPPDASDEARQSYKEWGSDAHTPSYLSKKELKEIEKYLHHFTTYPHTMVRVSAVEFVRNIIRQMREHDAERIVFWFDN